MVVVSSDTLGYNLFISLHFASSNKYTFLLLNIKIIKRRILFLNTIPFPKISLPKLYRIVDMITMFLEH
jgi:hypothetical protein